MKNNLHRTGKYLIIIGFFLLVVNVTLGIILTRQSSNAIRTMIRNRMLDISNTAAAMLDGDTLEVLEAGDEDTPEYQEVLRILTYYQDNIDLKYIYCIRDMGNKRFVFTVDPTIDDPGEFGEPVVYTDALYRASLGEPSVDSEPYEDDWGRFYSAYSPVFNSKHEVAGIVAVDFSADWYDRQISIVKGQAYIDGLTGLENRTSYMECLKHLEEQIEKGDMPVAMSKGYAIYDKEKDKTYKDTFSRADDAMYADKKAYYMTHEDRRKK